LLSFGGVETDLLSDAELHPLPCRSPCALGRASVQKVRVDLATLSMSGEIRAATGGPALPGGLATFELELTGSAERPLLSPSVPLELPLDNQHPPLVNLEIALTMGPELFDPVDWASLPGAGSGELSLAGDAPAPAAARAAILEKLTQAALGGRVQRSSP
jgi:hypothetical protein